MDSPRRTDQIPHLRKRASRVGLPCRTLNDSGSLGSTALESCAPTAIERSRHLGSRLDKRWRAFCDLLNGAGKTTLGP